MFSLLPRKAFDLDVCVELSLDCRISDETGNFISCAKFSSDSTLYQNNCIRSAAISANVTNIFNRAVAMFYQIDGGVASTVLKQPGESELIDVKKSVDLCNFGSIDDVELLNVNIASGWKDPSSPLVKCEEMIQSVRLQLPRTIHSPTMTPTEQISITLPTRPVVTSSPVVENSATTDVPNIQPTFSPSERLMNAPTTQPTVSLSENVTNAPTAQPFTPSLGGFPAPTNIPISISQPPSSPTPTLECSDDELESEEASWESTVKTVAPTKKKITKGTGLKAPLKKKCKISKGNGLIPKKSKKNVAPKKTKAPKKSCKKMAKVKMPIPDKSFETKIYFGVEIFTKKVEITPELSSAIVDGLNNEYKGGLVGCNTALQNVLANEGIVSIEFQKLKVAGRREEIKGLECKSNMKFCLVM